MIHTQVKKSISAILGCYKEFFPTAVTFEAPDPIAVIWGGDSVLEVDRICLRHLHNHTG